MKGVRHPEEFAKTLYQTPLFLVSVGVLGMLVAIQYLFGSHSLFLLERPRILIFVMMVVFGLVVKSVERFGKKLLQRWGLCLPTVVMWFHPMGCLLGGFLVAFLMLVAIPHWAGRGFWTDLLALNA